MLNSVIFSPFLSALTFSKYLTFLKIKYSLLCKNLFSFGFYWHYTDPCIYIFVSYPLFFFVFLASIWECLSEAQKKGDIKTGLKAEGSFWSCQGECACFDTFIVLMTVQSVPFSFIREPVSWVSTVTFGELFLISICYLSQFAKCW